MNGPTVKAFPVQIPVGFTPRALPENWPRRHNGHLCAGYAAPFHPAFGGGFLDPRGPRKLKHRALDIHAAEGALACAPSSCVVSAVEATEKGGNTAHLTDLDGWVWYFAHLFEPARVVVGQVLEAGAIVGYVGRTGNAHGGCPHLHVSLTRPPTTTGPVKGPSGKRVLVRGDKVDVLPFVEPLYELGEWRR